MLILISMSLFAPTISTLLSNISLGGVYLLKPMEIVFDLLGYTFSNLLRQRFLFLFVCIFLFMIAFGIFLKIFLGNNTIVNRVRMDFDKSRNDFKYKINRAKRIKKARELQELKKSIKYSKNKSKRYSKNNKNFTERQYSKEYLNSLYTDINDIEI